jgi:poly-gamma-glutamate capsule biosynthesis protein CapA/YwtB (metallophosphatase superfamily)
MTNASHVRNALARFDQVKGVSDSDRDRAFANIKKAAKHFGVMVSESHWRELGKKPHARSSGLD